MVAKTCRYSSGPVISNSATDTVWNIRIICLLKYLFAGVKLPTLFLYFFIYMNPINCKITIFHIFVLSTASCRYTPGYLKLFYKKIYARMYVRMYACMYVCIFVYLFVFPSWNKTLISQENKFVALDSLQLCLSEGISKSVSKKIY